MNRNIPLLLVVNRFPGNWGWAKRKAYNLHCSKSNLPLSSKLAFEEYVREVSKYSQRTRLGRVNPDWSVLFKNVEREIKLIEAGSLKTRLIGEEDYPSLLSMIADPPMILYTRGELSLCGKAPLAIVGTRRPTGAAGKQAFRIAMELSASGYPVVSGLAFGIDRAAHEGALAGRGVTWAVLAGGVDRPSPYSHRQLAHSILDAGGALISEIPPGTFPARYAFPRRNRILTGLCRGCLVVQAPRKSGALISADFALDQNRDLYVASEGISGILSGGTRALEVQGAPVVERASDILADWGEPLSYPVLSVEPPQSSEDLVQMMKNELDGRLSRYGGGWFEHTSV